MTKSVTVTLDAARNALSSPISFETFLARAAVKNRLTMEKHVAACDAEIKHDHARLWRRMACMLGTLAPLSVQTIGQQAVQFFVPDGKYKMQAFALEDARDGKLAVYCPDVMADALRVGLLAKLPDAKPAPRPNPDEVPPAGREYAIKKEKGQTLWVEQLDAVNTPAPPPHLKNMLGWNRHALRVTLTTAATESQVATTELLCALAAQHWVANLSAASEQAAGAAAAKATR